MSETYIERARRAVMVAVAAAAAAAAVAGCLRLGYVVQAGLGQLHLWATARPIPEVIADRGTSERTRALLREVEPILAFARTRGLSDKGNYRKYVQLDSPAVVWFMAVSEPLAFEPKVWKFPIVGSFTYLGWFSRDEARGVGRELSRDGWDVYIRPVRAYSTGGWFRDPVLSSMLPGRDNAIRDLANLLFHELTHANVFLANQSTFNESIATFIGDEVTAQYLEERFGAGSAELTAFRDESERGERRSAVMMAAYRELSALYASDATDAAKRAGKRKILAALDAELHLHYEPNNAALAGFKTYNAGLAELSALFASCDRRWDRFLAVIRTLGSDSFGQPQAEDIGPTIAALVAAGCPQVAPSAATARTAGVAVRPSYAGEQPAATGAATAGVAGEATGGGDHSEPSGGAAWSGAGAGAATGVVTMGGVVATSGQPCPFGAR